jgi:hypothetical protein
VAERLMRAICADPPAPASTDGELRARPQSSAVFVGGDGLKAGVVRISPTSGLHCAELALPLRGPMSRPHEVSAGITVLG